MSPLFACDVAVGTFFQHNLLIVGRVIDTLGQLDDSDLSIKPTPQNFDKMLGELLAQLADLMLVSSAMCADELRTR